MDMDKDKTINKCYMFHSEFGFAKCPLFEDINMLIQN